MLDRLSLASRLLGVALCLAGGWLMGDAQGTVTISNGVGSIIFGAGVHMANVGQIMAAYIMELVEQTLTPNYGSDWAFGIILAFFGFVLAARGDRKPRNPLDKAPLLTEPLYGKDKADTSGTSVQAE